jgi:hypothetical protein
MPEDHGSKDNFIHTMKGENRLLFAIFHYDLSRTYSFWKIFSKP